MTETIFKKNKLKHLFFSFILFLLIIFTLFIGISFLNNPSKYVYVILPNQLIVILVGILAIFSSFKSITNKDFYIRICEDGLFLGIIQYSNKLVAWNDIIEIKSIKISEIDYILILVSNPEYYKSKESGIEKYFFESRMKRYNSPFVINTNALKADFETIFKQIILNWEKSKNPNLINL
jgi:hypothetical protein